MELFLNKKKQKNTNYEIAFATRPYLVHPQSLVCIYNIPIPVIEETRRRKRRG
jgi:hypothetical protein